MKIAVVGGGNIGTLMAAEMAAKGHNVTIYSSKPEKWNNRIDIFDKDENKIGQGVLAGVTGDLERAICDADVIWITMPAQTFVYIAERMLPFVKAGQCIGVVPGSGGAEFAFKKLIDKGCTFFGLQRVHSIARLKEYGKSVYMLGRKSSLQLAAIPSDKNEELSGMVEDFFDLPCERLDNYLAVTLTPSNPILHTTRLYSMFNEYKKGVYYSENILFYEEWDDESSEMLIRCDEELQKLCEVLPFNLVDVVSLREYYESPNVKAMTKKIKSIEAFKGLASPMLEINVRSENKDTEHKEENKDKENKDKENKDKENKDKEKKDTENKYTDYKDTEEGTGWIPDFESRYFKADFSYGLKVILEIAGLFEVEVPNMEKVWKWYEKQAAEDAGKAFKLDLNREEFVRLYRVI